MSVRLSSTIHSLKLGRNDSPVHRTVVLFKKGENLHRNGARLEHPERPRFGEPDPQRKGMEGETGETYLLAKKPERTRCPVPTVSHHSMTGKPGVATDLMLAAGDKIALDERVMGASAQNPEAGFARDQSGLAFGMEAAPGLLREGPFPGSPSGFRFRVDELSMEESDIAFPDFVVLKLPGKVGEDLSSAGQEDHPARLAVEAVDRMKPDPVIAADPVPEVRIGHDSELKEVAEIPVPLSLDAQAGRFLHHEPARVRREDGSGIIVCCYHTKGTLSKVSYLG